MIDAIDDVGEKRSHQFLRRSAPSTVVFLSGNWKIPYPDAVFRRISISAIWISGFGFCSEKVKCD